jgi:hypothetical protein
MINSVYSVVLSILNKDSNGFITPQIFNDLAKQAQLEIWTQYLYDFRDAKNNELKGLVTGGYADVTKQIAQTIDYFSKKSDLVYNGTTHEFAIPDDLFILNVLYCNGKEVTNVSQEKLQYLLNSNLTAPTEKYPSYLIQGNNITVYPSTITTGVTAYYERYPLDPKWTYTVVGGVPMFNQSASDYQDFELAMQDFPKLVVKICEYAGVNIREIDVTNTMRQEEAYAAQQQDKLQ